MRVTPMFWFKSSGQDSSLCTNHITDGGKHASLSTTSDHSNTINIGNSENAGASNDVGESYCGDLFDVCLSSSSEDEHESRSFDDSDEEYNIAN
eukprot:14783407-Ditylum_brightwellii.AAC.1